MYQVKVNGSVKFQGTLNNVKDFLKDTGALLDEELLWKVSRGEYALDNDLVKLEIFNTTTGKSTITDFSNLRKNRENDGVVDNCGDYVYHIYYPFHELVTYPR